MAIALPDASTFAEVGRASVLRAGDMRGLTRRICERELDRLAQALPGALDAAMQAIETENTQYPEPVQLILGS